MITVNNLKKTYGNVQALKGINLSIAQGEFYGLLGPNGAGKSTTISIMSTILKADEGNVQINGMELNTNAQACKKIIGVVPQEIALYSKLSAYENLLFWGNLYNVESTTLKERIEQTLHMMGLHDRRNDVIKNYSGGMKRRINIASALLHTPKILFMDEPTVGIDPQSRNLIFEVVEKLHKDGMTIVYTTHYMEEAERFCNRVGIIDNGQIVAEGSLQDLRNSSGIKENILIRCASISSAQIEKFAERMRVVINQEEKTIQYPTTELKFDLPKIIIACSDLGLEITQIDIQKVSLETIFLKLTGKQLRD